MNKYSKYSRLPSLILSEGPMCLIKAIGLTTSSRENAMRDSHLDSARGEVYAESSVVSVGALWPLSVV